MIVSRLGMNLSSAPKIPAIQRRASRLTRTHLLRASVNRPKELLRASPLHAVYHLLRLGRDLLEIGSQTAIVDGHRLAFHLLQDDRVDPLPLDDLYMRRSPTARRLPTLSYSRSVSSTVGINLLLSCPLPQLRLDPASRRPTRWPSGSANIAMRGPSGTSIGPATLLPPRPSILPSVASRSPTST